MPEYIYSAIDATGQNVSGTLQADSEDACRNLVIQRGLYCLTIKPASFISQSITFRIPKLTAKELSIFCRQFSTMLTSGVNVVKCLDILSNQAERTDVKIIIRKVYDSVQKGKSLSESLRAQNGAFPDIFIYMVESGETGGDLDGVIGRVADHFDKTVKVNNKVKGAMMYPIILSVLTVLVVIIMMVVVLPVFITMFEESGAELPVPTKVLIGISDSLTGFWYIYISVICIIVTAWTRILKSTNGRLWWDKTKNTLPIVGKLNVIIVSSRYSRTLSALMKSGVALVKSLEITANVVGNKYYGQIIMKICEDIKKGTSLSLAMKKSKAFPMMMLSMITIGEEAGSIDEVLAKTSNFYDEESDAAISKLVGLLEPLMIVIMAGIIGFIVVSIMMPMYGMMTAVQ
ncbi:MAG: type II secretion system F family protein [Oscillospiraceae bacterium]|nr:type II secretion system F family protein [Oscillospiraceae bacterium]